MHCTRNKTSPPQMRNTSAPYLYRSTADAKYKCTVPLQVRRHRAGTRGPRDDTPHRCRESQKTDTSITHSGRCHGHEYDNMMMMMHRDWPRGLGRPGFKFKPPSPGNLNLNFEPRIYHSHGSTHFSNFGSLRIRASVKTPSFDESSF